MTKTMEYVTVEVPHQPRKGFRREAEEDPQAFEKNFSKISRELKSLQDRLTSFYLRYREERERHRSNFLGNLYQMDTYWFEYDDFDKRMFRFRCAWTNHLLNEIIEQLWGTCAGILKDLKCLESEIERILLNDLLVIKQNLRKGNVNNGVDFLIGHFNDKVIHSLKTIQEHSEKSAESYNQFLKEVEFVCNELTDRLILDMSMPEYEKSILGKELYQFRNDAKSYIKDVDDFNYELRELHRGTQMKKLRGLSKEEYKENLHEIIKFIEKAEVPLRIFKTVGFAMQKTEALSDSIGVASEDGGVFVVSGPLEADYPEDE